MMQNPSDQLSIRQQELEIERARVAIEFAKYGFAGTLTAAFLGAAVILGLACLAAFTTLKIESWAFVAISFVTMIGTVAFGFFSLWELPRIVAKFQGWDFSVNSANQPEGGKRTKLSPRTTPSPKRTPAPAAPTSDVGSAQ
jgi:hypothetical protein